MVKLGKMISQLRNKMIYELGEPPEKGIKPSKKFIFDAYCFYSNNKPNIEKEDEDIIKFSFYIQQMITHAKNMAKILYDLEGDKFYEELNEYLANKDSYKIIKQIIKKYMDNKHLKYNIIENENGYDISFTFNKINILMHCDNSDVWSDIKRRLDKKFEPSTNMCPICCIATKKHIKTCRKCSYGLCSECFYKIMKENKGVVLCPYCRNDLGGLNKKLLDCADYEKDILIEMIKLFNNKKHY